MARFLPILFLLLFVNGPVPLSGEFDDASSGDGQAVHQPRAHRIVGAARELQISCFDRPLQATRSDRRPRLGELLSVRMRSEPACKIPDRTSNFDSPSEEH